MAAAEGYGDHVMQALGSELLGVVCPDRGGDEALPRGRARRSGVRATARRGHEARAVRAGTGLLRRVVEHTDEATLARMWESAEAMPSLPELDEPRLWLSRTV